MAAETFDGLMRGGPGDGGRMSADEREVYVTHDNKIKFFLRGTDKPPMIDHVMGCGWYGWNPDTQTWVWGHGADVP